MMLPIELCIVLVALASFSSGLVTIEAIKSARFFLKDRKKRKEQEVKYFGRCLTHEERKQVQHAWKAYMRRLNETAVVEARSGGGMRDLGGGYETTQPIASSTALSAALMAQSAPLTALSAPSTALSVPSTPPPPFAAYNNYYKLE